MKIYKGLFIVGAMILNMAACSRDGMMDNKSGVDIKKYESSLNNDYSNSLQYHNLLTTVSVSPTDHASHHLGSSDATFSDPVYFKNMFTTNDSMFSEHFFEFCQEMMRDSGMIGVSGGMMGSNTGMMWGTMMGSKEDMDKMMEYMDSVHLSNVTMMNPDYAHTDSLFFQQMSMCKMMNSQTDEISNIYTNMQVLRHNHRKMHNN
jgi:hypothetical protein